MPNSGLYTYLRRACCCWVLRTRKYGKLNFSPSPVWQAAGPLFLSSKEPLRIERSCCLQDARGRGDFLHTPKEARGLDTDTG
jgi:hypothetical protein